jgi:hypothetical protein
MSRLHIAWDEHIKPGYSTLFRSSDLNIFHANSSDLLFVQVVRDQYRCAARELLCTGMPAGAWPVMAFYGGDLSIEPILTKSFMLFR